jgi:hypothetical protein
MTTTEMEKMIEYHDKRVKEIWELFAVTDKKLASFIEASRETDKSLKATDEKLASFIEASKETDKSLTERFKATDEKIKEVTALMGTLVNKWGQFVEYIVAPGVKRVFQARGIPIHGISQRAKRELNGKNMEVDILGINDDYALIIEVKSTLNKKDVEDFLEELPHFKAFFPEYANRKVIGAVAGIVMPKEVAKIAYQYGLFTLGQSGEAVAILNDENFIPKVW